MMFSGIVSGQTCHLLNTCGQQGSDWCRTCQWTLAVAGLSAQHIGGILSTRWIDHSFTGLPITMLFMELIAYIQRSRPLFTLIRQFQSREGESEQSASLGFHYLSNFCNIFKNEFEGHCTPWLDSIRVSSPYYLFCLFLTHKNSCWGELYFPPQLNLSILQLYNLYIYINISNPLKKIVF